MNARQGGFTLVELVVGLMISVVVVGFIATFIAVPVQSHMAQARRSDLAASAEAVSHWMSQDVRGALPNSLRVAVVGGRPVVEMIDIRATTTTATHWISPRVTISSTSSAPRPQLPRTSSSTIAALRARTLTRSPTSSLQRESLPDRRASRYAALSLRQSVGAPTGVPGSPASDVIRYERDIAARTLRRYDNLPMTVSRVTNGATDTLRVMKQLKVEDAA